MAAAFLREIFARLTNLENEIFVLKQQKQEPPPLAPVEDPNTQKLFETLKKQIDMLSKQLSTYIQSQTDMKKITEQSLLLKFDSIINKKIEQQLQSKVVEQQQLQSKVVEQQQVSIADELIITDSLSLAPAPPTPAPPSKKKKEKTTLNLE